MGKYAKSYLSNFGKIAVNENDFIKEINLLSIYLSHSNPKYQYNEMYLKLFCRKFLEPNQYGTTKNAVFSSIADIFKVIGCNVRLDVDKF